MFLFSIPSTPAEAYPVSYILDIWGSSPGIERLGPEADHLNHVLALRMAKPYLRSSVPFPSVIPNLAQEELHRFNFTKL